MIRLDEKGERIPLTIADWDTEEGSITLVFQEVGASTKRLGQLKAGDSILDFVGPLGLPTDIEKFGTVVMVGGGVGIAPIYPIARALKEAGNKVISIIGARNKDLLFWEDKMRAVSDELIVTTDDGSYGRKGLVTEPLKEMLDGRQGCDRVIGHRPRHHDEVLLQDHRALRRQDHRQPQLHHGGRHRHVRRLPRLRGRGDQVRLRGRPRLRRPPGGLGRAAGPPTQIYRGRREARHGAVAVRAMRQRCAGRGGRGA